MLVQYFDMRHLAGRNGGIVVTIGAWPVRVLRARGWTPNRRLHARPATASEIADVAESRRHVSWRYPDAPSLLADERALADLPPDHLERIEQVLR
jgi:hypothetical protein